MISVSIISLVSETHAGIIVKDDLGHTISLDRPAKRIISLYGAYNEILIAMNLTNLIKARTKADIHLKPLISKPSIGTHMRPNVEMVFALKPDLILQGGGRKQAMVPVNQLRRLGIAVAVFNPTTFDEIFMVISKIGKLTAAEEAADKLIRNLKDRLDKVKVKIKGIKRKRKVFFEIRYPNLLAAGKNSIVNDIIVRSGGTNCLNINKKLARLNIETLIECNPYCYVIQKGPMNKNPIAPSLRSHFHVLDAVKKKQVLFVEESVFSRPGPSSVEAVETLAAFLYPEIFKK